MRRFISAISVALIGVLLVVGVALAAWEFRFPTSVVDTSGTSRTYYPVLVGYGGQSLVDAGKIAANGLDTNMQITTSNIEFMMGTTQVLTVIPVLPSGGQATVDLYTGFTPNQTDFPVIVGEDGYDTIPDAVALEPANNFDLEYDGYVDTTLAVKTRYLIYKAGAIASYISATNDITSEILNAEAQRQNVAGADTGSADVWGANWFAQTFTPAVSHHISSVELRGREFGACPDYAVLSIRATSGGVPTGEDLALGTVLASTWGGAGWEAAIELDTPLHVTAGTVYAIVFRVPGAVGAANELRWTEDNGNPYAGGTSVTSNDSGATWTAVAGTDYDFRENGSTANKTVTATPFASGTYVVNTVADTVDLEIYIDAGLEDTVALAGATVLNNGNDWFLDTGIALPYFVSYEHTVAAVLIAHYEPITMIVGTSYNGTADVGGTWSTIIDAELTQANDYWNRALLTITDTTDDLAPKGEIAIITDFVAATDELQFASLTATINPGDTYTVDFGTLPDREGAVQDARMTWGVNADANVIQGEMVSFESTVAIGTAAGGFEMPTSPLPATWFAMGENVTNLPVYDSFNSVATQIGMPVQAIYFWVIIGLAFGVALFLMVFTRSALFGVTGMLIVLFVGSSQTIIPMWIPFVILIVDFAIMYLYRQVSY